MIESYIRNEFYELFANENFEAVLWIKTGGRYTQNSLFILSDFNAEGLYEMIKFNTFLLSYPVFNKERGEILFYPSIGSIAKIKPVLRIKVEEIVNRTDYLKQKIKQ